MSKTSYAPREGSLPYKALNFLLANPDETLDADAIAAKFGAHPLSIHTQLRPAVDAGLLARDRNNDGVYVYSLGSGAPAAPKPAAASSPWPTYKRASPGKPGGHRSPFWIDVDGLRIDKGVPLPSRHNKAVAWAQILDKLELGDSFLLPNEGRYSINKFATAWSRANGRALAIRKTDDGVRVWRVE
jgi:hypothetical protein